MSGSTEQEKKVFKAFLSDADWRRVLPLIESGAVNINKQDGEGRTLLHYSARMGSVAKVGWLLDHGADSNIHDKNHCQPLHEAASQSYTPVVELLLAADANPHAKTKHGSLPTHRAAWVSEKNLELLLDAGADVRAKSDDGRTITKIASVSENLAVQRIALRYLNYPVLPEKNNPLSKAMLLDAGDEKGGLLDNPGTWQRLGEVIERLQENGEELTKADVLQTSREGKTWLARAAECRVLPQLLQHLHNRGEWIGPGDLLDSNGQLTPTAEVLTNKGAMKDIFSETNWRGSSAELRQLKEALPENAVGQVKCWHALSAVVSCREAQQGRGR